MEKPRTRLKRRLKNKASVKVFKKKFWGKPKGLLYGLESFDVAVDFPFGDLCAVEVPFLSFFV